MIAHLFDSTVRVYRPSRTQGALKETVTTLTLLAEPTVRNCKVNRPKAPQADVGPGLAPSGTRVLYMDAAADVRERDVLELFEGPDAPRLLEADEVTRPRGHHTEVTCIVYRGPLPAGS